MNLALLEVMTTPGTHTEPRLRFDRGTLLLEGEPPDSQLQASGLLWDRRTHCHRAPAASHSRVVRALQRRGQPFIDSVQRFSELVEPWEEVELRPYQQAALGAWETSGSRGVLALPTGSGKTRIALAAMARAKVSTLVLVPTRVLLHQWRQELTRFYAGKVGAWGDGERAVAPLMVTTFESAYRQMVHWGNRFELLMVDEAHHFGNGMRDEALEMSIAPRRMGLTATPPTDPVAASGLDSLLGPVVFQRTVQELAGRYLADFDVIVLHLPLDEREQAAYSADRGQFRSVYQAFHRAAPAAPWSEFVAACSQSREGLAAMSAWRRMRRLIAYTTGKAHELGRLLARHREQRVLVFTSNNDVAYTIASQHLIAPLTCDIPRSERDTVLERFRSGEIRALVSSRVLNEGIDVPDAEVAIITGGSHGEREHIQRVGRLLRPAEGKRATVYELVAAGTTETRQARERRAALAAP